MTEFVSNVPSSIKNKLSRNLHMQKDHPICIMKEKIYEYFKTIKPMMETFDDLNNIVSIKDNFDLLLIPENHPSRKKTDTYYVDKNNVLRTHTSAHQNELLAAGHRSFLVSGDVYRKDEIDRYHYPIFHQMEGVHIMSIDDTIEDVENDLKKTLGGLVEFLFPGKEYRFNKDYFPFTEPSYEIEVKFGEKWLEILGCGVIHRKILDHHNIKENGWAFGFGLERYSMILFDIPDIRLFWTDDERFLSQFKNQSTNVKFKPYPKLTSIDRDISFWIPANDVIEKDTNNEDKNFTWIELNNFYELLREECGDNIESVTLYDKFYHLKQNRYSHTFRLVFSPNSNISNPAEFTKMTNEFMERLRTIIKSKMSITLR